ncbi:MAG: type II toxin-antitoxin system HicA family toxin [Leptolyngbyaceae cyanobacterium SM1_3_5]|nr:type II toxin-antitoxin system HicA family toxin [Leptolyngbyaceae cyanobacterium SM1_3_5]
MKLIKLVERFLSEPPEVRFEEVRSVLEAFGFVEVRSSGSHHTFRNSSGQIIVVPKSGGKMVKRTYVKEIVRLLNLGEWYANQKDKS